MPKYDTELIKSRLSCAELLRLHGYDLNRKNKCRCAFHDDTKPSMQIYDDGYHCFSCGAHGDVIDLTEQLYGVNASEAIRIAAELSGIAPLSDTKDYAERARNARKQATEREATRNALNDAYFKLLAEYARLETNLELLRPARPDEPLHPLFREALTRLDYVGYALQQCEWAVLDAERQPRSCLSRTEKNANSDKQCLSTI